MKENDYFLNLLVNPTFNPKDFRSVGLTMENTSLEDKETYKNIDYIRNNQMFQTEGAFDESKFDNAYAVAANSFKVFSNADLVDKISNDPVFDKYDIFVDRSKRVKDKEFQIVKTANPLKQKSGITGTNDIHESEYSVRENAQKELVWDGATQSWQEAPNDNFWENWKHTRVLAQYDEDVYDPLTGEKLHSKGEKKLNENGTYYYENLNGRDVYGREVLSKFDTLTTDGSAWNKFDFFDSDDKKKSVGGTAVRNVLKIVPALVPGVSQWYIGTRVALSLAEVLPKIGKIIVGSDSPTLSAIEGYANSLSFSQSDYARGSVEENKPAHIWSMENILNMAADVFLQLAEQRWIFERGPSLFMGKAGYDDAAKKAMQEDLLTKRPFDKDLTLNMLKKKGLDVTQAATANANVLAVDEVMSAYMKKYNTIGKHIGKAYMTGIVSASAYSDAKAEGLSDGEAALLTLLYAGAEYALLSTDVGKWVMPELKADKITQKQVIKKLFSNPNMKQPDKSAPVSEKINWIQRVIKKGRELIDDVADPATSTFKTAVGGALAEGVEETSEELLYDLSKALFNLGAYLRDDESRMTTFDDVLNRYAMSFVGGAMGGGLMTLNSDFKQAKYVSNLSKQEAYQMLVHYVDQGQQNELLKTAERMNWDSPDLMAYTPDVDGIPQYKSGNPKNNRNIAALDALRQELNMIHDILNANGGTVSDESLMNTLTNASKKYRLHYLQQSVFMPQYLQEFNTIQTEIVEKSQKIIKEYESLAKFKDGEKNQDKNPAYETELKTVKANVAKLDKELKELVERKEELLQGKRNAEFIKRATFQLSEDLTTTFLDPNFTRFVRAYYKKEVSQLNDTELEEAKRKWEDKKDHSLKDEYERAYRVFEWAINEGSDLVKNHVSKYFDNPNLFNVVQNTFASLTDINNLTQEGAFQGKVLDIPALILSRPDKKIGSGSKFDLNTNGKALLYYQLLYRHGLPFDQQSGIEQMTPEQQEEYITQQLYNLLTDYSGAAIDDLISEVEKAPFIIAPEKEFLLESLVQLQRKAEKEKAPFDTRKKLSKLIDSIKQKNYSPTMELVDQWDITVGSDLKTSELIKELELSTIMFQNDGKVDDFTTGREEEIKEAIRNIQMLRAAVLAFRTDNVSETNIVGYAAVINDIDPKSNLPLINKYTADVLVQDLSKIISTLEYYYKLHSLNSDQILKENIKLDTKITYLLHDRVKKLINAPNFPPENWNGVDELKKALNGLSLLEDAKFERSLNLDQNQRIQLKKDRIALENALHDFLVRNEDKDLNDLINEKSFNFSPVDNSLLSLDTEVLQDAQFASYLTSLQILNGSDFYRLYLNSIPDSLAPLPGQELATRLALTAFLDGSKFAKLADAYNKTLTINGNLDSKYQENPLDSNVSIDFIRTFLIDGIAGAGKTTAVLQSVFAMLQNVEKVKPLLGEAWFVGPTLEFAKKNARSVGYIDEKWLDEHCFDRETFLKKISPNYKTKQFDDKGDLVLSLDDVKEGEVFYRWNYDINKSIKYPSLIVIDEVSGLSQQDLLLVDDFSDYHGIMNFALGDYDQVSLHGELVLERDPETNAVKSRLNSQSFAGNFFSSWKLATTMRANNRLINYNFKAIRAALNKLKKDEKTNPIKFKYYEDDTTLKGWLNAGGYDKEEIKAKIEKWIKAGHKVGYAHGYDLDNELHEAMLELKEQYGPDVIIDKPGGSSQGWELDYYVVNYKRPFGDDKGISESFYELLYTGLTRATEGVIFMAEEIDDDVFEDSQFSNDISQYNLGVEAIKTHSSEYKQILREALSDATIPEITYKKFGGNSEVPSEDPTLKHQLEPGIQFIYDDELYTISEVSENRIIAFKINPDESVEQVEFKPEDLKDVEFVASEDETQVQYNQNKFVQVINNNPDAFNMLLESFQCHETGAITDDSGVLHPSVNAANRVDNINGLVKLYNVGRKPQDKIAWSSSTDSLGNSQEKMLKLLDLVRSALLHSKFTSNSLLEMFSEVFEIEKSVLEQLGTFNNINIEYHFKCTPTDNRTKSVGERLRKIFFSNAEPNIKHITAIFKQNDNVILEIPLLQLTHASNLIQTFGNTNSTTRTTVSRIFGNPQSNIAENLQSLIDAIKSGRLQATDMPKLEYIELFTELWKRMDAGLDFDLGINNLESVMTPLGMSIINKTKGQGALEYKGQKVSIPEYKQLTNHLVSPVYGATVSLKNAKGEVVVPAGKPFVLISDDLSLGESQLLNMYTDYHVNGNGKDPHIKLVKIEPPTSPLLEYLKSFSNFMSGSQNKANKVNNRIGTELTNYRLLNLIFSDNDSFKKLLEDKIEDFYQNTEDIQQHKQNELQDYEKYKKLFETLRTKYEKSLKKGNTREFINYLRGSEGLETFKQDLNKESKAKSWKGLLNSYLKHIVLSYYGTDGVLHYDINPKSDKQKKQIETLETLLKEDGWDGIFYHLPFKKSSVPHMGIKEMDYDINNPIYADTPIKINGKINSMSFKADISFILEAFKQFIQGVQPKPSLNESEVRQQVIQTLPTIKTLNDQEIIETFKESVVKYVIDNYETDSLENLVNNFISDKLIILPGTSIRYLLGEGESYDNGVISHGSNQYVWDPAYNTFSLVEVKQEDSSFNFDALNDFDFGNEETERTEEPPIVCDTGSGNVDVSNVDFGDINDLPF